MSLLVRARLAQRRVFSSKKRVRSLDGMLLGGTVLAAGGVVAREVLLSRRSESLLISLIAPARKETHVERAVVRAVVSRKRDGAVKTRREKADEKRQVKLDLAREEVQNGMVVIRQMTEEERRRNLARVTPPKRPGGGSDG